MTRSARTIIFVAAGIVAISIAEPVDRKLPLGDGLKQKLVLL